MASNLACIGLATAEDELEPLVRYVLEHGEPRGSVGHSRLVRWTDASGARLLVGVDDEVGVVSELLPLFDGVPGVRLAGVTLVNDDVARAEVVDAAGRPVAVAAVELEQRLALTLLGDPPPAPVPGVLVGLGVDVRVVPGAPESCVPPPLGDEPDDAEAYARLAGVVLAASRREVALTGQAFHAVRVRTLGVELDVCLPAGEHPAVPPPGAVLAGTVFLVGSLVGSPGS